MKIFYLIGSLDIGGSENQAAQTAVRMAARGHEVVFGCLRLKGPLLNVVQKHGIETIEFSPGRSMWSLSAFRQTLRLSKYLRKQQFDIVHNHDVYSNLMGVPAARIAGLPVISAQRNLGEGEWYTYRNRKLLLGVQRFSNRVVVNSTAIKTRIIKQGLPPQKVLVLHNGVDTSLYGARTNRREGLLSRFGAEHFVGVMVANMHIATKGHAILINALSLIRSESPQLRIALVGDGVLRPQLEAHVKQCGLSEHFIFLGQQRDVPAILASCDVGVLPSLSEGLPNSVLEYMAAGLPVIATEVGGIREIVEHGTSGMLIKPNDVYALADSLGTLVRDRSKAVHMGECGRIRVQREFTFDRLAESLEILYGGHLKTA